ncbi:hypothetical protein [Thiohalocapsa sp.]|uniref:hypothetical protein n=1 Tax=Thiohalocapsa sp. TaxID=2497641 RepID=UPI0025EE2C29|nr:hypothetical protein [Thiohalocapsa sp.]
MTNKTVARILILLIGVDFAVVGKYHESPLVLGLGLAMMGASIFWFGVSAVNRRRTATRNGEPASMRHRHTGASAPLWGMVLLLTGLGFIVIGVGIALA